MAVHATTPAGSPSPGIGATMRAVVQERYGDPGVLTVERVPVPAIGPDEVLVKVGGAGIDRGTWHLVTGLPWLARLEAGLRVPKRRIPGFDVAGTVVAKGAAVTAFELGETVCGIARGAFAEYAPALAAKLAHRPMDMDATIAGTLAISGLTALQAIRDRACVEAGQRVLVLGASGGVGTYAVQIARARGAHVTGVCSAAKCDLVRALGAETVIAYETNDPLDGSQRYDAIIDIGGRRPLSQLRRALVPSGVAVLVGGEGGGRLTGGFLERIVAGAVQARLGQQRFVSFLSSENSADIAELVRLVQNGAIRPAIDRVVALEGVADALRDLEAGRVRGKIAVRP